MKEDFTQDGITNFCSTHWWAVQNHYTIQLRHQHQFLINVWADIMGDFLMGLYVVSSVNDLPELMEDKQTQNHKCFMDDGSGLFPCSC
jgi:hypothetical protein